MRACFKNGFTSEDKYHVTNNDLGGDSPKLLCSEINLKNICIKIH